MKNKTKVVAARITLAAAKEIEGYCRYSGYVNNSDFVRDAIREKLQRAKRSSLALLDEHAE